MSKSLKPGWKMTEAQHALYFRLWGQVCAEMRWDVLPAKERDEWRRELHRRAFGEDKSAKDINALGDFDKIKAVFNSYLNPGDLKAELRQEAMPRTRALWGIEHELLPQLVVVLDGMPREREQALQRATAYVAGIAERKFGTNEFGRLPEAQLHQLFMTVAERVKARRHKLGMSAEELARRAGLQDTEPRELAASVAEEGMPF